MWRNGGKRYTEGNYCYYFFSEWLQKSLELYGQSILPVLQACSGTWALLLEWFVTLFPTLVPEGGTELWVTLGRACTGLETTAPAEMGSSHWHCQALRQQNYLIANQFIKTTSVSPFHHLCFVHFSSFKELGLLSAHQYPCSAQNLQCRLETTCEYSVGIGVLDCRQFVYNHLFALWLGEHSKSARCLLGCLWVQWHLEDQFASFQLWYSLTASGFVKLSVVSRHFTEPALQMVGFFQKIEPFHQLP